MALTAPTPQDWRTQQAIVLQSADAAVIRLLKRAQRDINAQLREVRNRPVGVGRDVREAQLNLVRRNLSEQLGRTWRDLGNLVEARRAEAVARSIDYQKQLDVFRLVGANVPGGSEIAENIARAEAAQSSQGIDRMMARTSGASYVPLSRRVYNSNVGINSQVDRMVNSAIARGLSVEEFAKELEPFVNPNTPGGMRYAALRLARSEIGNAAHAQAVSSVQGQPWIKKMKWNLSRSHPHRDICNAIAEGGPYGDGTYDKTAVPMKPHPQCFCFPTAVDEQDDDAFLDALVNGDYDNYLDANSGDPNLVSTPVAAAPPPASPAPPVRPTGTGRPASAGTRPPTQAAPPVPGAGPPRPVPAPPGPTLRDRLASGVERETVLSGGTATRATLLELRDRTRAIRKLAKLRNRLRNGIEMQDAEELASLLGRRAGLRVPEVVREDRLTIVMDFEEGRTPDQIRDIDERRRAMAAYGPDNPDVLRAGLFDFMIRNTDRSNGNFVLREDGGLALIDHGMSFNSASDNRVTVEGPGFARHIAGNFDRFAGESMGPSDRYSREDVEYLRQQLNAMRPEFERLDRLDWYDMAHENLNVLDGFARGNGRLFPDSRDSDSDASNSEPEPPTEEERERQKRQQVDDAKTLIAAGKTLPEVTAELKRRHGVTNSQALLIWQKANKEHKAEQQASLIRRPSPALVRVTTAPAVPVQRERVLSQSLLSVVNIPPGDRREDALQELRRQNALVPNTTSRLGGLSMATHADRVRTRSMDSLAWYQPWDNQMFLGDEMFSQRYANETWPHERATSWCSRTGADHSGSQAVLAHEFGHHVHNMINRLSYSERRAFWEEVSTALGIHAPQFVTRKGLEDWMITNQSAFRNQVSKYGATDDMEMLAEVWQEFSTSGDQSRPQILIIGQLMQRLAEKGSVQ